MSFLSGKADKIDFTPPGFTAGGLNVQLGPSGTSVNAQQPRLDLVSNLGGAYGEQADLLGNLRSSVSPGFNDLLKARLTSLNDSRENAIGNLRQNLDSRRVLGSSFGQDTISRAESEFGRVKEQAVADNFLKSLDVNNQLIQQEYTARRGQFQTGLDELNLEASVASAFNSTASKLLADSAQMQAKLDAMSAQGVGSFFGGILGKGLGLLGRSGGAGLGGADEISGFGAAAR